MLKDIQSEAATFSRCRRSRPRRGYRKSRGSDNGVTAKTRLLRRDGIGESRFWLILAASTRLQRVHGDLELDLPSSSYHCLHSPDSRRKLRAFRARTRAPRFAIHRSKCARTRCIKQSGNYVSALAREQFKARNKTRKQILDTLMIFSILCFVSILCGCEFLHLYLAKHLKI